MQSSQERAPTTHGTSSSTPSVQRNAGDSMRGAVRGMSFEQGAAALAPVQRKAAAPVQRAVHIDEMEVSTAPPAPGGGAGGRAQPAGGGRAPAGAQPAGGGGAPAGAQPAPGGPVTLEGPSITLNAPVVTAPGVMRVGTLVADNVVGTNYTPGAGNVM